MTGHMSAELAAIRVQGMSRAAFLTRTALAAGAAYGSMSASPVIAQAIARSRSDDVDILNFALTLEYLESAFYTQGLIQVTDLSPDESLLAQTVRDDEDLHVGALRTVIGQLGGRPVARPAFDFGGAFAGRDVFLKTANTLEDTGVSAYDGAAPKISSREALAVAGSIVQVEARHSALIRLARGKPPAPLDFDIPSGKRDVLDAVSPMIRS
jgi:rubrerythrin